jgi:hypothetical protein
MKFTKTAAIAIISSTGTILLQSCSHTDLHVMAFTPTATSNRWTHSLKSPRFATVQDETETSNNENKNEFSGTTMTANEQQGAVASSNSVDSPDKNAKGLPWWWDMVWKLDIMKTGEPGTDCTFGDSANVLRTNIEQIYGGYPSLDGCPLAEGDISDIADGTQFIGLQRYYNEYGSPYKLCFGPKSFLVISDPIQAKHILRDANTQYDKGLLAEILAPIMGKGLIPADPETWSVRRRQIVPAFHKGE